MSPRQKAEESGDGAANGTTNGAANGLSGFPSGLLFPPELDRVARTVNARIAPAVIERVRRIYGEGAEGYSFSGRWGTFRFHFILSDQVLHTSKIPIEVLVEQQTTAAVNRALESVTLDLVQGLLIPLQNRIAALEQRELKLATSLAAQSEITTAVAPLLEAMEDVCALAHRPWYKKLYAWASTYTGKGW